LKNRLDKFGKEISELNKILNVFAEISTESRPDFTIRGVSSSDFSIFIDSLQEIGACLTFALSPLISNYKNLLEIKKLRNELKKQNVPKENLKGIEDYAKDVMEKGIEDLIPKIMKEFYQGNDHGRKNELKIELRSSLKKIANRIDRGFNIEIHSEPIKEEESENDSDKSKDLNKYYKMINNSKETLKFLKQNGEPILSLPENEGSD